MPTAAELMKTIPDRFVKSAVGDLNTTVQFDLSGDGGGSWHIVIVDGELTVNEGAGVEPAAVVTMTAEDYIAMSTGKLNAMMAFMTGRVKVKGDMGVMIRIQSVLGM